MSTIAISGAAGDLGTRIVDELLRRVPAHDLITTSRNPDKLINRAVQGARVRRANYRDPASLQAAYEGSDILMLISSHAVTERVPEHRNVIAAAKKAGVKHIVYTSTAGAHPRSPTHSAMEHIITERDLMESGLGYTILRNQTYAEVFTPMAQHALHSGKWLQVGDQGMLSPVSKQDIARCAAVCLTEPERHRGAVYEITGPELLTFKRISQLFAQLYGIAIEYTMLTPEEMYAQFDAWGFTRGYNENGADIGMLYGSDELVTAWIAMSQGFHAILSHHVQFITGKPPTALLEIIKAEKAAHDAASRPT